MKAKSKRYVQNKFKKDGSLKKHKNISEKKFNRLSKRYAKQEGSNTIGPLSTGKQQVVSGRNPRNSVSRRYKMGGAAEMAKKMKPYVHGGHVVPGMFQDGGSSYGNAAGTPNGLVEDNRFIKKSNRLIERDQKLKRRATKAQAAGNTSKLNRIQNRRMNIQDREKTAFSKGFRKQRGL